MSSPNPVFCNFFFAHDTLNFNYGSWGHTTKFRLTERGYKKYVATEDADPICKFLSYID
jgi:hypothetical protein